MKEITQTRILRALHNNQNYLINSLENKIIDVLFRKNQRIKEARKLGYEACLLEDKERLELSYLRFYDCSEISKRVRKWNLNRNQNYEDIWQQSWNYFLKRKIKIDKKIKEIQLKYQVSGLKEINLESEDKALIFHRPYFHLKLIDSDFKLMKCERVKIGDFFWSIVKLNKMKVYQVLTDEETSSEELIETTVDVVLDLIQEKEWADIWESKYYLNYRELYAVGRTVHKKKPESIFDEYVWELNLLTGNGVPDTTDDETYFRAILQN